MPDLRAVRGRARLDLPGPGPGRARSSSNYHVLNFLDDKTGAENSTRRPTAPSAPRPTGKFQEFHNAVFARPGGRGRGRHRRRSSARGRPRPASPVTPLTTWKKCVADGTYTKYVNSVNEAAFKIPSFQGTPTVMINGEDVELSTIATPELLTQAIQNATK